ncbi:MAG: GNAT family N-acetyltransferase [Desulfobacterales bacterium]|jgi:ribosomal protein S18 acetylase RimI-like enzyme|nr:hypothetical protein [Desulfobacter sp.]MDP6394313.1 GNAT family N-acetyltransferase [Desulfobacterales bacterium]MDP6682340.1 GNAT family N-acetyltransferase [Desulfobacterales bacterium]MDP6807612.1 GNAT family N-acetyltransferase [Desulfobacterales bacterium]|tara:strand:+ start:22781 stop:23332 length:552 start_codon:yes stop_codon:yes gene_type:complete
MNLKKVKIRPLRRDDFDDVVEIDERVFNQSRSETFLPTEGVVRFREKPIQKLKAYEIAELAIARTLYYETKFTRALDQKDRLTISLVAEEGEKVVGFVMSELFVGEYGISATTATLDTIGVHPDYQKKGVGEQLMVEFIGHLRKAGVKKLNTLVDWNDWQLIRFFNKNGFEPAKTMNLELSIE